jgi:hypothetical protein
MSQDFDSQVSETQTAALPPVEMSKSPSDAILTHEAAMEIIAPTAMPETPVTCPLKLVASTAVSEPVYKSAPSQRHYFTAEVRRRSPDDFIMVAHDPFHYLRCELPLKFEEGGEGLSLVCQFPTIGDDELVDFIEEDEDLLGIVLITFNMHILQNLFSFCAAHKVKNLIIKATDEQFKDSNSRAECDEFMDDMTTQFRKTLWQEQITNSAIRDYLKANVRLSVVH